MRSPLSWLTWQPPPRRPPLSHAALHYLWQVYQTASEVASTPARIRDPGPANHDYATAIADTADDTDLGRLVTAALVGHDHGMHHGHGDGAWSASAVLLSQLGSDSRDSTDTIRIYGRTPAEWLRAVDSDARSAADADRAGQHHNHNPAAHAATGAFAPLPSIDPTLSAETNPRPPGAPPTRPAPNR